jgi:hypothetical protein
MTTDPTPTLSEEEISSGTMSLFALLQEHGRFKRNLNSARKRIEELEKAHLKLDRVNKDLENEKWTISRALSKSKASNDCHLNCLFGFLFFLGSAIFGLMILHDSWESSNRYEAHLLDSLDWNRFEHIALDKLATVSSYDIMEIEELNRIDGRNNTALAVKPGSWQVYQFLAKETGHITKGSPKNKQEVWQGFARIIARDRDRRLQLLTQVLRDNIGVCI